MRPTPEDFIKKWKDSERTERAASQQHLLELCTVLDVPKLGYPDRILPVGP